MTVINGLKQVFCFTCSLAGCLAARRSFAVFLCMVLAGPLLAQPVDSIGFTLSKKEITATNEELVDIVVKITNKTHGELRAVLAISAENTLEIISKNLAPVSLQAGESVFIPVKIFVKKSAKAGKDHTISFMLQDEKKAVLAQAASALKVNVKRSVNLFALVSNILLDNNTDSIKIPIRVINSGNTAQAATIICRFPAVVQDGAFHTTSELMLQPLSDTIIYFTKPLNRRMVNSDGFDVNVTGLYANSDIFGMAYVRIQSARSNRHYKDLSDNNNLNENSITISSQSMFSPNQSYLISGRGGLALPAGRIGYNLDLTTWKNGYSPAMVRSSWLSYEAHNMGIKAGNINRNLDLNLTGRGASVFVTDTANDNRYEAGYIDGNTNLIGNSMNSFFPTGHAAWGTFTHTSKRWELNSFAVYEATPSMNAKNIILGNDFSYTTPKRLRFTGNLSAGHTSEFLNSSNHKFGMAASAGITGNIKNISLNSLNYFSTAYYPGIRRGALSFSERVTWLRPGSNLWASADYYRYAPRVLSLTQFFLPEFSTLRAETGLSGKVFKEITLSVAPGFIKESSNSYQFTGTASGAHSMTSWNVTAALNYPIGNNHYLSVNTETGIYSSTFDPARRFHQRSNINYKNGIFNVNGTVQLGTFYMGEAANNFSRQISSTHSINIIPTVQKAFYRNKLKTEAGIAYMNNSYSGNNWYLTGRMEYDVMHATSVYTAINHNRYGGYALSIVEMGITQKLKLPKVGAKTGSLELVIYKDLNQNGMYESADSVAGGYLIYINDIVFITSSNGDVEYKNLPPGNYRVSMPISKGWYAPEQNITVDKKRRVEIALQRTGTLKGTVAYKAGEFSYEINKNVFGLSVIATDEKNNSYKTKTNMDGLYVFYIPVGNYTISISPENLPAEVEPVDNNRKVNVETGSIKTISHELNVKDRKIETKKFTSPSMQKRK